MPASYFKIGDRVRLKSEEADRFNACFCPGEVYTVTYFVNINERMSGLILDHCSSPSCKKDCVKIEGKERHGQWVAEIFELVIVEATAEELASASPIDFSLIDEAERFCR